MNAFDAAVDGRSHYAWPYLTDDLNASVVRQISRSLSDRDASGVIGEFEEAFRSFVGSAYAVSFSSGTGALHALARVVAAPGAKIIAPAYTFFATATPFAYEGVEVLFADAGDLGNVTRETIEAAYEPGVTAVIVTHMWGVACDMPAIAEFCRERGLSLFEDCSHAHFGSVDGRRVGLHGDAAVFSTNQKAITSGEGGVLVTGRRDLHDAAILFGHYNKRSFKELAPDNPDRRFALTGWGLKYRMHTLSAALGIQQLAQADDIEARRRRNLALFKDALAGSPVVHVVDRPEEGAEHGLYVLGLRYDETAARVPREQFVADFIAQGGRELDVPGSTKDISGEPLFRRATGGSAGPRMPGTDRFGAAFMKLPLWGYPGDERIVEVYARSLRAAADEVQK